MYSIVKISCSKSIDSLLSVRTHYNTKNEYIQGLLQAYRKQEGIECIFVDKGSHCCSGDSKKIRLRDKYATRPTIYVY